MSEYTHFFGKCVVYHVQRLCVFTWGDDQDLQCARTCLCASGDPLGAASEEGICTSNRTATDKGGLGKFYDGSSCLH